MASLKSTPKDAQVMSSILREIGIQDYEPRVLNQMLEFCYRYVTNIVDDAQFFSSHAKRKTIDIDDIKVAADFQSDKYFTNPPPREMLISIARQKNSAPLPLIKATTGIRLPPDRYSLTACNYRLKYPSKKPRVMQANSRLNIPCIQTSVSGKLCPVGINGKSGLPLSSVTKPAATTPMSMFSRGLPVVASAPKPNTPIIKFSDGNHSSPQLPTLPISNGSSMPSQIMMPSVIKTEPSPSFPEHGEKRKLEDDADDYDAE